MVKELLKINILFGAAGMGLTILLMLEATGRYALEKRVKILEERMKE